MVQIRALLVGLFILGACARKEPQVPVLQIENSFSKNLALIESRVLTDFYHIKIKPDSLNHYYFLLRTRFQNHLPPRLHQRDFLNLLTRFLYDSLQLKSEPFHIDLNTFTLYPLTVGKKLSCVGFCNLIQILIEGQEFSLSPVYLPGHVYLSTLTKDSTIHFESLKNGRHRSRHFYDSAFNLSSQEPFFKLQQPLSAYTLFGAFFFNLGNEFARENQLKTACSYYNRAREIIPEHPTLQQYHERAKCHYY